MNPEPQFTSRPTPLEAALVGTLLLLAGLGAGCGVRPLDVPATTDRTQPRDKATASSLRSFGAPLPALPPLQPTQLVLLPLL